MFDDISNLNLYDILCIFNYMDEYNANYSYFIYHESTFSTMDEILAAVFVAEEHLPSFEPEMWILYDYSIVWNWKLYESKV